jgi:hypothetical protein
MLDGYHALKEAVQDVATGACRSDHLDAMHQTFVRLLERRNKMESSRSLREHLVRLLREGNAHLPFDRAIAGIPPELRGRKPRGIPHSPWRLLEHLRICQWDILEFSRDPKHVSPQFPEGYWPASDAPPSPDAWQQSIEEFSRDLQAMIDLVAAPTTDLFEPIPHGDGQTILREALLVADHNAYHVGQLVAVRQALGCWPGT